VFILEKSDSNKSQAAVPLSFVLENRENADYPKGITAKK
jgi:hypothetical protein